MCLVSLAGFEKQKKLAKHASTYGGPAQPSIGERKPADKARKQAGAIGKKKPKSGAKAGKKERIEHIGGEHPGGWRPEAAIGGVGSAENATGGATGPLSRAPAACKKWLAAWRPEAAFGGVSVRIMSLKP
ncbi:hypothetical protein EMIHUDRAFT_207666 [Emiliania huxleyi CCMP1516]|uniref:Uncharacterized protein n=2 Tax=Emiliania huxleyi TaxID=2903 RepID=A0A0D3JDT3_EMIH1|nr:hypothetical protein EMIHUDRAFT_207666 [Emiliania huxleyi CCMP1516]EOD21668.1 hypothetical protein EMIHUDRAFT_207666 [Emiliania huxleyi CCMP1516]|eukprot:XP_005774097.1 hypothetical protein EMIHUDRAFT_207666 [Emiliania huxleyi CCMP1516]